MAPLDHDRRSQSAPPVLQTTSSLDSSSALVAAEHRSLPGSAATTTNLPPLATTPSTATTTPREAATVPPAAIITQTFQPYSLPPASSPALSKTALRRLTRRPPLPSLPQTPWRVDQATRPLLLTLDAYGTLFTPTTSIAAQYRDEAARFGLALLGDEAGLERSFRAAYKVQSAAHPNFGAADVGRTTRDWWAAVIAATMAPLLPDSAGGALPPGLVSALYARFASAAAYTLFPDVPRLLSLIGTSSWRAAAWPPSRTMLGILSNSDSRVASILSSFGMPIHPSLFPPRYAPSTRLHAPSFGPATFAFAALAPQLGHAKPDARAFAGARIQAQRALDALHPVARLTRTGASLLDSVNAEFHCLHVGDDVDCDVLPALAAGWDAVLLDRSAPEPVARRELRAGLSVDVINSLDHLRALVTRERFEEYAARLTEQDTRRAVERRPNRGHRSRGRRLVPHPASGEGENLVMLV